METLVTASALDAAQDEVHARIIALEGVVPIFSRTIAKAAVQKFLENLADVTGLGEPMTPTRILARLRALEPI